MDQGSGYAILESLSESTSMLLLCSSDHPYQLEFIPDLDLHDSQPSTTHTLPFRPRLLRPFSNRPILIASNGLNADILSTVVPSSTDSQIGATPHLCPASSFNHVSVYRG